MPSRIKWSRGDGWREVHLREARGEFAVHLFGKRPVAVAGPQTGLNVPEWNPVIVARERGGENGRRISYCQNKIRTFLGQAIVKRGQRLGGQLRQRLTGAHQTQVAIGRQVKIGKRLLKKFLMLAGAYDPAREPRSRPSETVDDRGHLDGLRAGAHHAGHDRNHCADHLLQEKTFTTKARSLHEGSTKEFKIKSSSRRVRAFVVKSFSLPYQNSLFPS